MLQIFARLTSETILMQIPIAKLLQKYERQEQTRDSAGDMKWACLHGLVYGSGVRAVTLVINSPQNGGTRLEVSAPKEKEYLYCA
jgi:hypothetical protein